MKNVFRFLGIITLVAVVGFTIAACTGGIGGGKQINSAAALKEYLDSQPANSPDNPIKVTMAANDNMIADVSAAIDEAGKYVSLNLTGNALTQIIGGILTDYYFGGDLIVSITIPASVTFIHMGSGNLTSVTLQGTYKNVFEEEAILDPRFPVEGGPGTYTRVPGGGEWTKK